MSDILSSDVERVLRSLQIQGNTVKITEQLDRPLYQAVNEVLERLGGKWNRSTKVHIFPGDPTERLNTVLQAGKLDPKIKTGYFPTPPEIGKRMVEMLGLKPGDKVLEPSAGQGGLLDQLPKGTHVTIGEILPENIQILKEKGYTVNFDNFLGVEIEEINKVVMNPPFENQQDIEHVTRALKMLQPGGTLVSVMSPGIKFRDNKKTKDFLEMLDRDYVYEIIDLPEGSFKSSGTGVNTVLLKVEKPMSTPSTVSSGFVADISKVNKKLADRSHAWTSMEPEVRAKQEIAGFGQYVQEVYEGLKKAAHSEAQKAFVEAEIKTFQDRFAKYYNELLARKGNCASTFITGGSGFNVRRAEKANDAEHAKYEEMIEFQDRAQAAILRELRKMAIEEAGGELEVLKKKLADAEKNQEYMKLANAILRKKTTKEEKIKEIMEKTGLSEATVSQVFKANCYGDIGFERFELTNNNANIRRMQERVKELEKKEATPSEDIPFEGGTIADNADLDRVQINFNTKPNEAMIAKLKGEGWRWSPSNSAWQRKRTDMALRSARRLVGLPDNWANPKFLEIKKDPTKEIYDKLRDKAGTEGVNKFEMSMARIIAISDNAPLRQQDTNRLKTLISSLPNLSFEELKALGKTVTSWGERITELKAPLDYVYSELLKKQRADQPQPFVSTAPDKLVSIVERSNVQVMPAEELQQTQFFKDQLSFLLHTLDKGYQQRVVEFVRNFNKEFLPANKVITMYIVEQAVSNEKRVTVAPKPEREEFEKAKLFISALARMTPDELIQQEATVRRWSIKFPELEKELEDEFKLYIELRTAEKDSAEATRKEKAGKPQSEQAKDLYKQMRKTNSVRELDDWRNAVLFETSMPDVDEWILLKELSAKWREYLETRGVPASEALDKLPLDYKNDEYYFGTEVWIHPTTTIIKDQPIKGVLHIARNGGELFEVAWDSPNGSIISRVPIERLYVRKLVTQPEPKAPAKKIEGYKGVKYIVDKDNYVWVQESPYPKLDKHYTYLSEFKKHVDTLEKREQEESVTIEWTPQQAIKLAADTVETLRKPDVFRVLTQNKVHAKELGAFIKSKRVDLANEVEKILFEFTLPTYELYYWNLTHTPHLKEKWHIEYKVAEISDKGRREFTSFGSRYFETWGEIKNILASGTAQLWVHDVRGDHTVTFKPVVLELPRTLDKMGKSYVNGKFITQLVQPSYTYPDGKWGWTVQHEMMENGRLQSAGREVLAESVIEKLPEFTDAMRTEAILREALKQYDLSVPIDKIGRASFILDVFPREYVPMLSKLDKVARQELEPKLMQLIQAAKDEENKPNLTTDELYAKLFPGWNLTSIHAQSQVPDKDFIYYISTELKINEGQAALLAPELKQKIENEWTAFKKIERDNREVQKANEDRERLKNITVLWNEIKNLKIIGIDVKIDVNRDKPTRTYYHEYINIYMVLENGKKVKVHEEINKERPSKPNDPIYNQMFGRDMGEPLSKVIGFDAFIKYNNYEEHPKEIVFGQRVEPEIKDGVKIPHKRIQVRDWTVYYEFDWKSAMKYYSGFIWVNRGIGEGVRSPIINITSSRQIQKEIDKWVEDAEKVTKKPEEKPKFVIENPFGVDLSKSIVPYPELQKPKENLILTNTVKTIKAEVGKEEYNVSHEGPAALATVKMFFEKMAYHDQLFKKPYKAIVFGNMPEYDRILKFFKENNVVVQKTPVKPLVPDTSSADYKAGYNTAILGRVHAPVPSWQDQGKVDYSAGYTEGKRILYEQDTKSPIFGQPIKKQQITFDAPVFGQPIKLVKSEPVFFGDTRQRATEQEQKKRASEGKKLRGQQSLTSAISTSRRLGDFEVKEKPVMQPENIKSLPFKKPIPHVIPGRFTPKKIITPPRRLYAMAEEQENINEEREAKELADNTIAEITMDKIKRQIAAAKMRFA